MDSSGAGRRCSGKGQSATGKFRFNLERSGTLSRTAGEPEDLYQIGAIGLLKCIEKFDFSYDVKFSTYAVPMILGEIKRFLRDDGTVKVSRSLKELAWRAKRLQEAAMQEESRELSLQELAEQLEVEKEELVLALESTKDVESLYASVDGNEGTLQLIDKLADNTESEKMMERLSLMEAIGASGCEAATNHYSAIFSGSHAGGCCEVHRHFSGTGFAH